MTAEARPWVDTSPHTEGTVLANGVRLHYLDWGGDGSAVVLIPGLGENPHVFDDLAPALTDTFRVLAYARRGTGRSEARSPYDTATLTQDLLAFMDALRFARAHLVGWSFGGNEITRAAADHADRVGHVVYFDSYDGTDTGNAYRERPKSIAALPESTFRSLEAYCAYVARVYYDGVDRARIEAALRENVLLRPDGSVALRMSPDVTRAQEEVWLTERRAYSRVTAPALAIFAESLPEMPAAAPDERRAYAEWREALQATSVKRLEREMAGRARIMVVPGNHKSFWLVSRETVAAAVREHLRSARA
jgi:pimeloyl-ACP methyl ester carboxylesterase